MIGRARMVTLVGVLLVAACDDRPHGPPVVPDGMRWLTTTSDDPRQWREAGFVELTTPVRPPTTEAGDAHIVVVLRVPPGATIATAGRPWSFTMPVGSTAARVEYRGAAHDPDAPVGPSWRVLDVRQFDWTADGVDCSVLRPDGDGHLVGLRWRCGEADDARAGALLAGFAREGRFAGSRRGRGQVGHRLQVVNDCRACHQLDRAEDRRVTALVQRGTDAVGLFSLRSVFGDEDPVERYRPVDTNAGDPWMTPRCPGSSIDLEAARCRDGLRPHLRLDVPGAVRAHDPHAIALCETRRQLAAWLDAAGRATVQPALEACGPS